MNKRVKTSSLWSYFTDVGNQFAKCDICEKRCSYKTTTNNLKKHLERLHPTVILQGGAVRKEANLLQAPDDPEPECTDINTGTRTHTIPEVPEQQPSTSSTATGSTTKSIRRQTSITAYVPKKVSSGVKKTIDRHLLGLFTFDFQPFSIVEDKGFVRFVSFKSSLRVAKQENNIKCIVICSI